MSVKLFFSCLAIASILLVATMGYLLSVPVVAVTAATRDAIQPGMTLKEVEAVVGGPPGWYDGISSWNGIPGHPIGYEPHWVTSTGQLVLEMDANARVTAAIFAPTRIGSQDLADMCFERLTRGADRPTINISLIALAVIFAAVLWLIGLVGIGVGSPMNSISTAGPGVWLRVGKYGISFCAGANQWRA